MQPANKRKETHAKKHQSVGIEMKAYAFINWLSGDPNATRMQMNEVRQIAGPKL